MTLNCVIIDDEPLALELLKSYVEKTPFLKLVGEYSSAVAAMKNISSIDSIDSYKVNALDYLLKPISYTDFIQSVNKAVNWFEMKNRSLEEKSGTVDNDFIFVKSDYKLLQIPIDKILYIEGLKDYIKIHLEGETRAILSLVSIKNMEEKLPSDKFIRVHRSYIVQKQKIKVIDRGRIVFGKDYIPVSESYKKDFLLYLNQHSV